MRPHTLSDSSLICPLFALPNTQRVLTTERSVAGLWTFSLSVSRVEASNLVERARLRSWVLT